MSLLWETRTYRRQLRQTHFQGCQSQSPKCECSRELRTSFGLKKIVRSLLGSAQAEGCVDQNCATPIRLNASALFQKHPGCYVPLSSPSIPNITMQSLIDSGSSHCFIDDLFTRQNKVSIDSIPPVPLELFDGSNGSAAEKGRIPEMTKVPGLSGAIATSRSA